MEDDKRMELLIYFEDLRLVQAEFFYYKYIAKNKNNVIEKRLDKASKTVGGYITASNIAFKELKLDPTNSEVHHVFRHIAPGIPPYGQWPPEGYEPIERPAFIIPPPVEPPPEPPVVPPIKPPIKPPVPPIVPIVDEEPPSRRFGWVAIVAAGIIIIVAFASITALIVTWVQRGPVSTTLTGGTATSEPTDTKIPTDTPIPTDTIPPTATEDIRPLVAAIQTQTAEALPTVDDIATALVATSDHLTSIAPTETSTSTPTPNHT